MNKRLVLVASFFGFLAVVLGAFGTHGLKQVIDVYALSIWEKAVQYQFYHVFALLFLAYFQPSGNRLVSISAICFTLGIVFFSGSLYVLATETVHQMSLRFVGPVTPVGGMFLILGWATLFFATLKSK